MAIENLIDIIDCYLNNGDRDRLESQDKIKELENGAVLVQKFSSRDWLALRNLNLTARSNL